LAAVAQDVGVFATSFFQSVGKHGQAVERTLVVNGLGHPSKRPILPGQPIGGKRDGSEKERAENITKKRSLNGAL
jgi:hypothetical protein